MWHEETICDDAIWTVVDSILTAPAEVGRTWALLTWRRCRDVSQVHVACRWRQQAIDLTAITIVELGNIFAFNFRTWHVKPGETARTFDHGSSCKGLSTEARHWIEAVTLFTTAADAATTTSSIWSRKQSYLKNCTRKEDFFLFLNSRTRHSNFFIFFFCSPFV